MCVALVRKGDEKIIDDLVKAGFERLPIPAIKGKPVDELAKTEKLLAKAEKDKENLESRVQKLVGENFSKLAGMKELLEIEQYKKEASLKFGSTEDTIIVEGYLPEKNFHLLEKSIVSKFGQRAYVEKISSEELERNHEQAPTLLNNNRVFKPFQFIVNYMSTPKSNEIDTTVIFAFVFMLFYGMIVGDVIYGLVSFFIARWVYRKSSKDSILKPVSLLWMYGAVPTIIAGIIFDEYAGLPHRELFSLLGFGHVELYTGFERMHNTQLILAISLLIGIITMAFAFLLGFINAVRHHDKKHASAKLAWFGIVITGTVLVATSMFKAFPDIFMIPSAILFAISTIIMIKVEGPIGLIEIPSVAGNILSFARLIAVGLVGTVIAFILNEMAMPSPDKGLMLIVFLPIFILGHLFNAFLAMFEALIQGARLNFVEFYSKFFEGGGKEFQPFKLENKYLKSMEVD
jgi:V/A-type H+-transporting ATPase subunit I